MSQADPPAESVPDTGVPEPFILDLTTRDGRVCERYRTFADAKRRLDQFPTENLIGLAFIFEEFADGSERVILEDGKPLQLHRGPVEEAREIADDPLPLAEDDPSLGGEENIRSLEPPPPGWGDDLPLSE